MPNPFYIYIKYDFVSNILDESDLIVLHIVKSFQVFLSNMNNFIYYESFVCSMLNGSKYCSNKLI